MSTPTHHLRGGRWIATPEHAEACAAALGYANDPEMAEALRELSQSIEDSRRSLGELMKALEDVA